jgi:hypothetical protein
MKNRANYFDFYMVVKAERIAMINHQSPRHLIIV